MSSANFLIRLCRGGNALLSIHLCIQRPTVSLSVGIYSYLFSRSLRSRRNTRGDLCRVSRYLLMFYFKKRREREKKKADQISQQAQFPLMCFTSGLELSRSSAFFFCKTKQKI